MNQTWKEDFIEYLNVERGYTGLTAKDYAGRVNRVCKNDHINIDQLAQRIDDYIYKYEKRVYMDINQQKHNAPSNGLKRFKEYLNKCSSIPAKHVFDQNKKLCEMTLDEFNSFLKMLGVDK